MFYHFSQNNSGGSFHLDKLSGITCNVIIEADSADEANFIAEDIGIYFDGAGDCPCCGNRWCEVWESDGREFPHIYGENVTAPGYEVGYNWMEPGYEIAIHYKNGTIVWI